MLTYSTAAARRALASIIQTVQLTGQRVVITRYGRPLVAIVPMDDPDAPAFSQAPPRRPGASTSKRSKRRSRR